MRRGGGEEEEESSRVAKRDRGQRVLKKKKRWLVSRFTLPTVPLVATLFVPGHLSLPLSEPNFYLT
jgi:hypothetical protein